MMKPAARFVSVVFGTAAYIGLAILGWGGFAAFFSHPALVALAIVLFALSGVALFAGGNLSPGIREDRTNRWVILVFALVGLLDAICLPTQTGRSSGSSMATRFAGWASASSPWAVHCGFGLCLCWGAGSAGSSRSSPDIRWSPAVFTM